VTEVTRPAELRPRTSARPEAAVIVVHELADDGQFPEPGDGLLAVTVRVSPAASASDFSAV
jgi:hypothetical protein